ncbi:MAG TPA: type I glyceraldehyde-3-phosphate dehydrogenase [Hanamia sp.]
MRVAINGMGRIGRLLFRRLSENPTIEIVAVNDLISIENLAYLVRYDSVYGTFSSPIKTGNNSLYVLDREISVLQTANPLELPWQELDVDVVLECTGHFLNKEKASMHLKAGAKKVLLSTTGADDIPLMVYGFNQKDSLNEMDILSPGGCMTNCSVHILYLLNAIGIKSVHVNILHSYTSRQSLVDMPHDQFRRGRAAAESIIPVAIDLNKSLNRLLPSLNNKINVYSTRVPVANGAMASFTIQLKSNTTTKQINKLFENASQNQYKDILEYTEEPLVSLDIKGNTHSCIIDATQTAAIDNHVRVVAWFDNEYGFTSRMIDWLNYWNVQMKNRK